MPPGKWWSRPWSRCIRLWHNDGGRLVRFVKLTQTDSTHFGQSYELGETRSTYAVTAYLPTTNAATKADAATPVSTPSFAWSRRAGLAASIRTTIIGKQTVAAMAMVVR